MLAIVTLLFTFVSCPGPNSESSGDDSKAKKGVISGRVIYENVGTNADLSGINVFLEKLEEGNRSAAISASFKFGCFSTRFSILFGCFHPMHPSLDFANPQNQRGSNDNAQPVAQGQRHHIEHFATERNDEHLAECND